MNIRWEFDTIKDCHKILKLYSTKSYYINFLINLARCYFSINIKYIFNSRKRYNEYDWMFDVLNSNLYCMSKSIRGLRRLIQTSDDMRYNYWLTEPDKLENIIKFVSSKFENNKKIKFLDLGSGPGLIFKMMPKNYICSGYEINERLTNIGRCMKLDIKKRNILEKKEVMGNIKDLSILEKT